MENDQENRKEGNREEVTVVIPVWNREELVLETLASVEAQTWRPLNVVLVDNGSTDGTLRTLMEWKEGHSGGGLSVTVLSEPKPGACSARQTGLEASKPGKVLFFDSDDLMHPQLVEKAMRRFRETGAELVYWKCRRTFLDGSSNLSHFPPPEQEAMLECHMVHALLSTQAYMADRSLFLRAGGWNPDIPVWNDFELGVRILKAQPEAAAIGEALVEIRSQAESITGTGFCGKAGQWEKSLDAMEATSAGNRSLLRVCAYRRAVLAAHYRREGNESLAFRTLAAALAKPSLSALQRAVLRLAYLYTSAGGRGAWLFSRFFLGRPRFS